ncbi:sugar ABC transporter permease [Hydrogenibacillus schlegelii]|uniref:ABC transporter permease n=1 Tax=Hydrogenibacillus schlegelii TaxID=1484 RepID=A0A132MGA3_HYDSH|nr:sugar ABC transporter permease [Hydrogenibacillus schlegelii]KWW96809.1 ABC transporter permease [Hydrogenibacillus schlegelii]OAR04758.1 ABC transporter permease [Hydrogenibacillus schlegelii]
MRAFKRWRPPRLTGWVPLALVAPAALLLGAFVYLPVGYTLYLSFLQWNMISPVKKWVGLANYAAVLTAPEFWIAFGNTVLYTALLFGIVFALPYLLAYGMAFRVPRAGQVLRGLYFLPSVLSLAVASILYFWLLHPLSGPIARLLSLFGLDAPAWFSSFGWVIVAIALITAWKSFGYHLIVFLAGMASIPRELIEAARIDNVSPWKIFWHIVRPLTSATALYVLVLTVVMGAQYVFVPIQMLTGGGPDKGSTNLIFLTYQYAFQFFQTGRGAAAAVMVILIFAAFLVLQKKVLEKGVYYEHE